MQAGSRHTLQAGFSYVGLSRLSWGQQAAEVGLPSMARHLWQDTRQPPLKVRWVIPVTMCMSSRQRRNRVKATTVCGILHTSQHGQVLMRKLMLLHASDMWA